MQVPGLFLLFSSEHSPLDEKVKLGPLINKNAVNKVNELVNDATLKGAKIVKSGRIKEMFYPLTILDKVTGKMKIAWEETFGPVMTIIRVKNLFITIAWVSLIYAAYI